MRAKTWLGILDRGKVILGSAVILAATASQVSVSDVIQERDPCEREAMKAYVQALKLCQLADQPNPRLRCYEAAKAVYFHTVEECQKGSGR